VIFLLPEKIFEEHTVAVVSVRPSIHPSSYLLNLSSEIDDVDNKCFTSCSRIFHLCGDVNIAGEGLQNLGLCSALKAFEQGGIFIMPHLL
jgi:hypothetical protein